MRISIPLKINRKDRLSKECNFIVAFHLPSRSAGPTGFVISIRALRFKSACKYSDIPKFVARAQRFGGFLILVAYCLLA